MAVRLSQAERAYFVRKLGGTQAPTKPLNQIKREYWAKFLADNETAMTPYNDMEWKWMLKVITDSGQTPMDTNFYRDWWVQMAIAAGQTPSQKLTANQLKFYLNAA